METPHEIRSLINQPILLRDGSSPVVVGWSPAGSYAFQAIVWIEEDRCLLVTTARNARARYLRNQRKTR